MSPPAGLGSLVGAWVRRERRSDGAVELEVEDVRWGPVRRAGVVVFTGVLSVEAAEDGAPPIQGPAPPIHGAVDRVEAREGVTVLDVSEPDGPGEGALTYRRRYVIRHAGLQASLPPRLGRTLRALVSRRPAARDRGG